MSPLQKMMSSPPQSGQGCDLFPVLGTWAVWLSERIVFLVRGSALPGCEGPSLTPRPFFAPATYTSCSLCVGSYISPTSQGRTRQGAAEGGRCSTVTLLKFLEPGRPPPPPPAAHLSFLPLWCVRFQNAGSFKTWCTLPLCLGLYVMVMGRS